MDGQSGHAPVLVHRHGKARNVPSLTSVDRLHHSNGVGVARIAVSCADVHGIGVQGVNGDGAYPQIGKQIRVGGPGATVVVGTPKTASGSAGI